MLMPPGLPSWTKERYSEGHCTLPQGGSCVARGPQCRKAGEEREVWFCASHLVRDSPLMDAESSCIFETATKSNYTDGRGRDNVVE